MNNLQRIGGLAALYLAAAYLMGIVFFLFVLDYPNIVDPAQKNRRPTDGHLLHQPDAVRDFRCRSDYAGVGALRAIESRRSGHYAGGNRDWNYLGGLAGGQRHGLECGYYTRRRAL